ncbi:MAG: DPP IV N-terminal domain-containing protein, partial [Bryobacteraceae bacterium]
MFFVQERDGYAHLYTVSHAGGDARQLTSGTWEIWDAKLSRDKERFYLTTNEAHPGERHFYAMNADGGERKRLTGAAGVHEAEISPDERKLADVFSYVNRPPELFLQDARGSVKPAKVTDSPLAEFWTYL